MYLYMYFKINDIDVYPLGSIISERNDFTMTFLLFIHLNIPFGSDMLSPCISFIVYRENYGVRENLSNIIFYLNRNNCCLKTISNLYLLLLG